MLELGIMTEGAFMNDGVYKSGSSGGGQIQTQRRKPVIKVDLYYQSEKKPFKVELKGLDID